MTTERKSALVRHLSLEAPSELGGPLAWGALAGVFGGVVIASVLVLAMAGDREGTGPRSERRLSGAGESGGGQSIRIGATERGREAATGRRGERTLARSASATGTGARTGPGTGSQEVSDPASLAESGSSAGAAGQGWDPSSAEDASAQAQANGDGGSTAGGRGACTVSTGTPATTSSGDAEEPPAAGSSTDPDLLLLQQLGVDLTRPEAEMRRLAAEYRAALLASTDPSAPIDPARQSLLDRGMAALLRVKPQTTGTVNELLQFEIARAPSRYFANLLRGGQRTTVEPALAAMAGTDPDPSRRGSAVLAFGPTPGEGGWPSVLAALRDPAVEVRETAAGVIASSARLAPTSAGRADVREALRGALVAETDPAVRLTVLRVFVGPSGAVSATDRAFLASLGRIDAEPYFQAEWTRAVAAGN